MKIFSVLLFIFSLGASAQTASKSCAVGAPYYLYQFASVLTGQSFPYVTEKTKSSNIESISIGQCQQEAQKRRLLMIGVGADYNGVYSDTVGASYVDELVEDKCQIQSSLPVASMGFQDRKANFLAGQNAINTCALFRVTDVSGGSLTFVQGPANECQVEQIGRSEAIIHGRGICYIRLTNTTQLDIKMSLDSQCADQKMIAKNGIAYGDYYGRINLFSVADVSSRDTSLAPIKSVPFRITIEGDDKIFPMASSLDPELPRWPAEYPMPETFFGEVIIKKYAQNLSFKVPYFVDNRCPLKCKSGNCGANCQYATPFSSSITFMEWNSGKGRWEDISIWYDGAIIPPQWQGLLISKNQQSMQYVPVPGRKYKLVATFGDPKEDFIFFNKRLFSASTLRMGNSRLSSMPLDSGAQVPRLGTIANGQKLPEISSLPSYARGAQVNGLAQTQDELSSMLDYNVWPADYTKVCNSGTGDCLNISGKTHTTLELEFQLELNEDGETFNLINAKQKRFSSVLSSSTITTDVFPQVICSP